MKIDNALKLFVEKYDDEAMGALENLSNNLAMNEHRIPFHAFNIKESVDQFCEYLEGYANYKINNIDNPKASSQDSIRQSVNMFIEDVVFVDKDIQYKEIPEFVMGYVNGVSKLMETIDHIKSDMMNADVDLEYVGDINGFADSFMEKLDTKFDPIMDRALLASGYVKDTKNKKVRPSKPVFL